MRRVLPHGSLISSVTISASAASIGLVGGLGLQAVEQRLLVITPLLIALPALNMLAGDYATLITSHFGDPEASRATKRKLILTIVASVPICTAAVVLASLVLARAQGFEMDPDALNRYAGFVFAALFGVAVSILIAGQLLNIALRKRQLNSDDILIPVSNVLASVIMLSLLAVATRTIF